MTVSEQEPYTRSPEEQYEYERIFAFDRAYLMQEVIPNFPPTEGLPDKDGALWSVNVEKDDEGRILSINASGGLHSFVIGLSMNEAMYFDRGTKEDEPIATRIDALRIGKQKLDELIEPFIVARRIDFANPKVAEQGPTGTTLMSSD